MSTSDDCNDGASKSNDDGVCEMNDMLQNMSTTDNNNSNDVIKCANCGKESSDVTNTCNKCKSVMYCNAVCKKKHRSKHKKECCRRVAERAAELHDEQLFKQPPPQYEDCPICLERMPSLGTGRKYKSCCGKVICSGCIYAVRIRDGDVGLCPFCRSPAPTSDEETIERLIKLVDADDPTAMYIIGGYCANGMRGIQQNYTKALELYHRAGDLGHVAASNSTGYAYDCGRGAEVDKKKAVHYYELAAMMGDETARHNLGIMEEQAGNIDRASRHYMIAAKSGDNNSLKKIQQLYSNGYATKDDYTAALQGYQAYLGEIKSGQRDEAAAASTQYRYY